MLTEMQSGSVLHLSACLALETAHSNTGQTAAAAAAAAAAADAAATAAEAAFVAAASAQQAANAATIASARASTHQENGRAPARRRAVRPDDSWRMAPQKRRSKSPGYHQPSHRTRRLTSKQRQQWTAKGCLPEGGGHSAKAKDGQPRKAPPRHYWSPVPKGHQQSSKWKVVEHQSSASGITAHQSSQTTSTSADDQTNPGSSSNTAEPQRFSLTGRDSDDDEADFFPKDSVEFRQPHDDEVLETSETPESSEVTATTLHVPQEAPQDDCLLHQSHATTTGAASGSNAEESGHNESQQTEPVEKPLVELHAELQEVRQTEPQAEVQGEPHAKPQTEAQGELHKREEVDPQQASGVEEHR